MERQRWRKLVLASYGNLYLQGQLRLDDWYRHSLLWNVHFIFRDADSGKLLADGWADWLRWIKARGAVRLSIEMAMDEHAVPAKLLNEDRQLLVCHFPSLREYWILASERSEAVEMEFESEEFYMDYRAYEADLDGYWRFQVEGVEHVFPPRINWKKLTHELGADEAVSTINSIKPLLKGRYDPFFANHTYAKDPWSDYSTLPDDASIAWPHRMLEALRAQLANFKNLTNCKNDSSPYVLCEAEMYERLERCHASLQNWTERIQCLAGSEAGWRIKREQWLKNREIKREQDRDSRPAPAPAAKRKAVPEPVQDDANPSLLSKLVAWSLFVGIVAGLGTLAWTYPKVAVALLVLWLAYWFGRNASR